jgi:hypothetical protein
MEVQSQIGGPNGKIDRPKRTTLRSLPLEVNNPC